MVVPSIISQIIHVVYNLADTWFVGLTGNPDAIAAVSLCLPLYNILTGLSNLFGVGGASVIARAVGYEDYEKEKRAFSIAFWAAGFFACLYSLFLFLTSGAVLRMIGADPGDLGFSTQYYMVTIVAGGVPTVLAATLSNLIRATGESRCAAKGMTIGALGNIVLDPITVNHTFNFAGDAHAQILSSVFQARLFVYADMESRVKRCMERNDDSHRYSEREIERLIRRVDSRRARYYRDHTGQKWGDKQYYDFCINTTGKDIKAMVKHVAGLLSER